MKFYTAVDKPMLLYGSEDCKLVREQMRKWRPQRRVSSERSPDTGQRLNVMKILEKYSNAIIKKSKLNG